MRDRGYTMAELVVSLAIVALLAGILVPTVTRAVEGARRTRCVTNLKQIGTAMGMYQSDWELYPPDLDSLREAQGLADGVFVCPSDPAAGARSDQDVARGHTRPLSYRVTAPFSPLVIESPLFYRFWLQQDPLAGPLVACFNHTPAATPRSTPWILGIYADGHVARCRVYTRHLGDVTEEYLWPFAS